MEKDLPTTAAQQEGKNADAWLNAYYRKEPVPFEDDFLQLYADQFDPFRDWEIVEVQPNLDGIYPDMIARSPLGHLCVIDHKFLNKCPLVEEVEEEHQFIMYAQRAGVKFFILNWLKRGVTLINPVYNKDGSLSKAHKNYKPPFGQHSDYAKWFSTVRVVYTEGDFERVNYDLDMAEKMSTLYTTLPERAKQSGFSSPCRACGYRGLCRGKYDWDAVWEVPEGGEE